MGILADLRDLFTQTVSVKPFSSVDDYGQSVYGAAVEHTARVVARQRRVFDTEGVERISVAEVWLLTAPGSVAADFVKGQLTLPDGTTPPILNVERIPDEDGDHHVKVYVGAASARAGLGGA